MAKIYATAKGDNYEKWFGFSINSFAACVCSIYTITLAPNEVPLKCLALHYCEIVYQSMAKPIKLLGRRYGVEHISASLFTNVLSGSV